jgi:hypothetical protein
MKHDKIVNALGALLQLKKHIVDDSLLNEIIKVETSLYNVLNLDLHQGKQGSI